MVIAVNVGTPTTYTPSHVVHDNAYKYATQHPAIPFLASSSQPFYFLCEILHFIDGNVLPVAHNNPVLSVHFLPHFRDQVVLVPSCHSLQHRSNCPLDVAEAISHSLGWAIDLAGSATKGSRVPVFPRQTRLFSYRISAETPRMPSQDTPRHTNWHSQRRSIYFVVSSRSSGSGRRLSIRDPSGARHRQLPSMDPHRRAGHQNRSVRALTSSRFHPRIVHVARLCGLSSCTSDF